RPRRSRACDARASGRLRAPADRHAHAGNTAARRVRIVDVTVFKVDASWRNWVFLRVDTDSDLVGYGECTVEGREYAVEGAVKDMARRLIGKDPRRIRDLSDLLTRRGYWDSGPVVSSAAGGIE